MNCPTDRPRTGLSGSAGLFTHGPGDCVGTIVPPFVPGSCSAGPPGGFVVEFGSLPYTMSEMQLPTEGPLCAFPAASPADGVSASATPAPTTAVTTLRTTPLLFSVYEPRGKVARVGPLYLMKRISEYFGSGQRSSGTIFSSRSATSRVASMAGMTLVGT